MRELTTSDRAVLQALRGQGDLISRSQALAAGLTKAQLRHRLRPGGPWTVVLPGVYLAHNGVLTAGQREIAAMLHCGDDCCVSGSAALWRYGIRVPYPDAVDVLVPASVKRLSDGFVQVHRTFRMPERPWVVDGLRYAPPARAVGDAARWLSDQRSVRDLVADAVQRKRCTIAELAAELRAGPPQRSVGMRAALEEVADGVASVAEGDLRKVIKQSGLPAPIYNPRLYVGSVFLAKPDAWWPEAGLASEVDSREWHLSPQAWATTMLRHDRMTAHGVLVLHFPPSRLRFQAAAVIKELTAAYEAGAGRKRLPISVVAGR